MMTSSDYLALFQSSSLTSDPFKLKQLDSICKVALANEMIYRLVEGSVQIPWPLIAAIHFREADQSFKCHLHNGDPLTDRTTHYPSGRPHSGKPPFTWTASAIDALGDIAKPRGWDLASCLEFLEQYNGLGYQRCGVNSPYLWDFTDKYESGLFVSDGRFDPTKKESRPGCVAILKTLENKGVSLDFSSLAPVDSQLH